MSVRFCTACGTERRSDTDRFCPACGTGYHTSTTSDDPRTALHDSHEQLHTSTVESRRPMHLAAALTFVTCGVYLFYWFGRSWAEMKRELQDEKMYPGWHALTLLVPIYNLFRLHAHFRTINQLLERSGDSFRLNPSAPVIAALVMMVAGQLPETTPLLNLATIAIGVAMSALIVGYGEQGLNTYWKRQHGRRFVFRLHWAEWVSFVIGSLVWLLLLLGTYVVLTEGV